MNKIIQIIRERIDGFDTVFVRNKNWRESGYTVPYVRCEAEDIKKYNKATIIAILEEILKETDKHNYFFVIDEALKELRSEMDKPSKK